MKRPTLFIISLAFALTACQTPKDDPLNPTQTISPVKIPERTAVVFHDVIYGDNAKELQCPTVYQPVCATISQNGQIFKKTFSNKCNAVAVLNIKKIEQGACE
ncbi:MAG: lipoprotein [Moraxella sp.]|uniref:lipoprotein n=1 Tax=Moraxella sp. TaxID=479 RepID=UPI0026DDC7F5|nr:lipoprotein [Moraxella sp.]MDO4449970.1 lipoprotein [Moraxella sp.]